MKIIIFLSFLIFSFSGVFSEAQVGFTQKGRASFYADRFHGRKTANGEKYDKNSYTGAHRELPFGTHVKVTNSLNNKSVIIKINDRGPHNQGRILDVSGITAKDLDMISKGTVMIHLEVVENSVALGPLQATEEKVVISEPSTPASDVKANKEEVKPPVKESVETKGEKSKTVSAEPKEPKTLEKTSQSGQFKETSSLYKPGYVYNYKAEITHPKGIGLQLGTFSHIHNAFRFCKSLEAIGMTYYFIVVEAEKSDIKYKILLGEYSEEDNAKSDIEKLNERNIEYIFKKYPSTH